MNLNRPIIERLAWEQTYRWLVHQRRHAPENADIWHVRFHWQTLDAQLWQTVIQGHCRFTPMQHIDTQHGAVVMWSAIDALVLKWLTLCIMPSLPKHPTCRHLKGHGGVSGSLTRVRSALSSGEYRYVFRTDIRGYYANFPQSRLLAWLFTHTEHPVHRDLLTQYVHYSVEWGGEFFTPTSGIARACPLSPLIGGSYLYHVDEAMSRLQPVLYERYMDDFLLLSPMRWPLRRAIAHLNGYLADDGFEKHPDKTQIGRIGKGFGWLGRWFTDDAECVMRTSAMLKK
ncbi:TPA: reverse transcriptase domain-containing protein [Serratia fonticola]|uniref:reverse transcriptase domain-containing protein n=1 Tax=Serratia fonticola TaxID=47917 RepID=UPI0034C6D9B3